MTTRENQRGVTLAAVRRWPATVNVTDAAKALGVSRASLYAALARGERPVRVLVVGRRMKVVTSSLLEALEGTGHQAVSA